MLNFLKKWLAVCLAMLIVAAPSMHVFAERPAARILSVFRVDGDDAFLSWGLGGRGMEPRSGQRLSAGNVMSTGLDTQVYMNLDAASIVKMDEQSQVSVDAAGNRLTLSILSGSALVEVDQLAPAHTLETRIGGTVMSVRGTLFIAALGESGAAVFTMLSGEGVVYLADETGAVVAVPLRAGYVFWAYDYTVPGDFAVLPINLQTMSLFELQETYNHSDFLLGIGTITPAMQQQLPNMIGTRRAERDAARAAWDAPAMPMPAPTPPEPAPQPMQAVSVGDIIPFGGYDWRVLEVRGNQALILTDRIITQRQYHAGGGVTWETSDIRQWLNNDFLNRFSEQERARIASSTVINDNNPWDFYGWAGGLAFPSSGNNTTDRIFLLSIDEVLRYFGDDGLVALGATMSAAEREAHANPGINEARAGGRYSGRKVAQDLGGSPSAWWLRTTGRNTSTAAIIGATGNPQLGGLPVTQSDHGIRPALWLYLDS